MIATMTFLPGGSIPLLSDSMASGRRVATTGVIVGSDCGLRVRYPVAAEEGSVCF